MRGRCLCGAVRFETEAVPTGPSACHCVECRRQSGHVWAAASVPADAMRIEGGTLRWFAASEHAERGFCGACGSFLFMRARGSGEMDVALGALDGPTGLRLERHIWVSEQGDYYAIADGVPQHSRGSDEG